MLHTTRRICVLVAFIIGTLHFSCSQAHAQPPFPQISITSPANGTTYDHGDTIHANGTSNQPNTAFTLVVTNIYTSGSGTVTNTHTLLGTTDDGGSWEDSSNISIYGPGSWKVEVYFTGNPQIKDMRSGTVRGIQ